MHVTFDGRPVTLYLSSPFVVMIDPLALDGHSRELADMKGRSVGELASLLARLSAPLRIGLHEVLHFRPGLVQIGPTDLERVEHDDVDQRVVDVDSGTIVFVDLAHLPRVASVLTWERYDLALQAPVGGISPYTQMLAEPSRPDFALLFAADGTAFDGDGAYLLKSLTHQH